MPGEVMEQREAGQVATEPLLFTLREYVIEDAGKTTTCIASNTSPVKEYTPDD